MPSNAAILQLHELLAARGLAALPKPAQALPVGWQALDEAAGMAGGSLGLPKGGITELPCPRQGGALTVHGLLAAMHRAGSFLGLIDGEDGFDPASSPAEVLLRLLWVRCRGAGEAVQAADLLLRDGNLPLVLLSVRGCADAARVPSQVWYRLQRLVEQSGASLLVLTSRPLIPSARVRVGLEHCYALSDLAAERAALEASLAFTRDHAASGRGSAEICLASA